MSAGAWAAYRSRIAGRTSPTRSRKSPEIKPFCGHRSTYSRQAHCIKDRVLLEPACGCAEFSIVAAAHAAEVVCFDLDDQRLSPEATHTERLRFEIMDATAMHSPDGSFDTVVLYNAIGHLAHIAEPVLWECLRVVNATGVVWVVSSFRMDKAVIQETLLPLLDHMELSYSTQEDSVYTYVQIRRKTNGI